MQIKVRNLDELPQAATRFAEAMGGDTLFAFSAPMGAGKTTFIAEVCRCLGVTEPVNSPTFSIVNEYRDGEDRPLYHFDFYRMDDPRQALDIGVEDYFASGCVCFMEWPENVEAILPDDTVSVSIEVEPDGSRVINVNR